MGQNQQDIEDEIVAELLEPGETLLYAHIPVAEDLYEARREVHPFVGFWRKARPFFGFIGLLIVGGAILLMRAFLEPSPGPFGLMKLEEYISIILALVFMIVFFGLSILSGSLVPVVNWKAANLMITDKRIFRFTGLPTDPPRWETYPIDKSNIDKAYLDFDNGGKVIKIDLVHPIPADVAMSRDNKPVSSIVIARKLDCHRPS